MHLALHKFLTVIFLLTSSLICTYAQADLPELKELSVKDRAKTIGPAQKNGKWGYADEKGKFVIKPYFDSAEEYRPASLRGVTIRCAKVSFNGKYGYLYDNGLFMILPEYDSLSDFDRATAIFTKDGSYGLMNTSGNVLMAGFDLILPFDENGLAWVSRDGLWGMYDISGSEVFKPKFSSIPSTHYGALTLVEEAGRFGLISILERRTVLPSVYEMIAGGQKDGNIVVRKDGKYGLHDENGKMLIPPLMNTDQVSAGADMYKYMDSASGFVVPMVYQDGKALPLKTLEAQPFEDWQSDNAYIYPGLDETSLIQDPSGLPEVDSIYVTISRDRKVLASAGLGLAEESRPADALIRIDTTDVPCGVWLVPLLKVDQNKLAAYDKAAGTTLAKDWQSISAKVRRRGLLTDGNIMAVIDVSVDSLLMQRHFVKFSMGGARKLLVTQDGILYDPVNYVDGELANCFVTPDQIVIPVCTGPEKSFRTRLLEQSGKQITELPGIFCELVLGSGDVVRMLVRDEYSFSVSEVDMISRKYKLDDLGISSENMCMDYYDAHAYIYERESGMARTAVELKTECTTIPLFKYKRTEWDGEPVVALSANIWDVPSESAWIVMPRPLSEPRVENINGYLITVYPPGPDGISRYCVSTNIWTGEGLRYGYIGYDTDCFIQPLFEDIRAMAGGEAAVKIDGEWKTVHKEDLMNNIKLFDYAYIEE